MKTFIKYFTVGGVAAAFDFTIFGALLYGVAFSWFCASLISFVCATAINYVLSVRHVFESGVRFRKHHEISLVFLVSAVGLAVNQFALYVSIVLLEVYPLVAKVGATGGGFSGITLPDHVSFLNPEPLKFGSADFRILYGRVQRAYVLLFSSASQREV